MKLLAIDGNSLVNRAFYGVRGGLSAPDGTPTNALVGFLNMLHKLLDQYGPEAVCVCFDMRAKTFRHLQYDGYKGTRKPMPEELAVQMPLVKQALDLLGFARMEKEGYEADDLLGTLARICREQGEDCIIVTGDRDSLQYIAQGATVSLITTRMGQNITEDYDTALFQEKYQGLTPDRIVDLKAIMGDASDNIPGVPGIGEKGAMTLLTRFGSLRGVYENLEDKSITPAMRRKLEAGKDSAEMSYRLAMGEVHVPVDRPLSDLLRGSIRPRELYEFFARLGLMAQLKKWNVEAAAEEQLPESREAVPPEVLETGEQLAAAAQKLAACGKPIFLDVQNNWNYVALHQEGTDYILDRERWRGDYDGALKALVSDQKNKVAHDIKPLLEQLADLGLGTEGWSFDTALAAYLLDASASRYGLEELCMKYCGFRPWQSRQESGNQQISLLEQPQEADRSQQDREAASRAAALEELSAKLRQQLEERDQIRLYEELEFPLIRVLGRMERVGFTVDRKRLTAFGDELSEKIEAAEKEIYELAGHSFTIGSPKQLGVVLFEEQGLKAVKKTKTGYSTDAESLEKLRPHPLIEAVLDWRKLTKLRSTYVDGLLTYIREDGRIHSRLNQMVTATGRLSSADPNLQNIPVRRELGTEVRRCFLPREGWVLLDADYSQIELRVLAHMADDRNMQAAFLSGQDIHAVTASQVFDVPLEEVSHALRSRAKAVNFGIVYGISAFSLSQDIGVYPKEAQAYIDAYLGKYSGVARYMDSVKEQAKKQGYVTTLMNRRRDIPELKSANFNTRSFGERVAMNSPIQGTAADIIKLAMLRVDRRLEQEGLKARLLMQVHDELIVEAPPAERDRVAALMREEMEGAMALAVPLTVEVSWGENWYEAKK